MPFEMPPSDFDRSRPSIQKPIGKWHPKPLHIPERNKMAKHKDSIETLQWRAALEDQILALLSQTPKDKLWPEREITQGLGQDTVSICALERLQEAGKVKLTLDDNHTYLCQLL
jgi:hypothetical protein